MTTIPLSSPLTPIPGASIGVAWDYQVVASDPNGDVLTYSLDADSLAIGLTIDSGTGRIDWANPVEGTYRVEVLVEDGRGRCGPAHHHTLPVTNNSLPSIDSIPIGPALVGEEWIYPIIASDPDEPLSALIYTLDPASDARGIVLEPDPDTDPAREMTNTDSPGRPSTRGTSRWRLPSTMASAGRTRRRLRWRSARRSWPASRPGSRQRPQVQLTWE